VEGDDQRESEGTSDRQGERAAAAEMRVDQPRLQRYKIRRRWDAAKLFENEPVKDAGGAAPSEQDRFDPQIRQTDIRPTPDPNRRQAAKADILPTQKMRFRARDDAVSIHKQRAAVSQTRLTPVLDEIVS
jgi:hypothetical protein